MAAAVAPPVNVNSPAGNPSSDCPIYLAANSEVVSSTPCLEWQPAPAGPGGIAQVQLKTFQAVKAFLPRCKLSRIAADMAAANAVNMLTVRLTDACWSRILTELRAAQVFASTANSIDELHDHMKEATIPTPANLDLVAGDWSHAEAFALPGGAGGAAVAARALLAPLRFLSLLVVPAVEEPATPLPLGLLCTIVGALGPCLTQAARRVETSTVQLTAATLRLHLAPTASTDALLAVKVASFFRAKLLPFPLRCVGVTEVELREELEDGIEYKRSDQGKVAIEEKRVHLLATGYAACPFSPSRIALSRLARVTGPPAARAPSLTYTSVGSWLGWGPKEGRSRTSAGSSLAARLALAPTAQLRESARYPQGPASSCTPVPRESAAANRTKVPRLGATRLRYERLSAAPPTLPLPGLRSGATRGRANRTQPHPGAARKRRCSPHASAAPRRLAALA